MSFDRAQRIADSVLLEGYVLYPYRASSGKNRYRWTFGVIAPRCVSEATGSDPWRLGADCLVEGDAPKLSGRLRFLQVQARAPERKEGPSFHPVARLDVDSELHLPWEEGVLREIDFSIDIDTQRDGSQRVPFIVPGATECTEIRDTSNDVAGRIRRTRSALQGTLLLTSEPVREAHKQLTRVSLQVDNLTSCASPMAPRAETMHCCLASAHVLLALSGGSFLSPVDPPPYAEAASANCERHGFHPVLAGEAGRFDLMLYSPIVLYDHPEIAPESPGDFFDACEIDELLALRTLTLTPEEKKLARATDARAAELLNRVEAMSDSELELLHGAIRQLGPEEPYAAGDRVRLRPGKRRTDAQDLLFAGCAATIHAVMQDVDGQRCLAVTIDEDPAAELHQWYGRFHYYYYDEVERIVELGS